jgi:MFS transporter, FHS family, L-fucose permease
VGTSKQNSTLRRQKGHIVRLKTVPIFLAFFLMGIADAMGPMSDAVKHDYELSNFMSRLLSFFVFIAFAAFSVPGGLLAARIGKKNLLLLGLGLNSIAVLIPTILSPTFYVLLGCIFLLGIGTTFLQVSGNPIMRDVSAEGRYGRNLSFAQGVKGIGSTTSTYLVSAAASIALLSSLGWRGAFPIFLILMVVTFVAVALLKVNETIADTPPSIASSLGLLATPTFFLAVLGIFLYVGAEASMANFLLPALKKAGLSEAKANTFGPTMFFLLLTIGRILGGIVLMVLSARTFFRLSALLGLLGAAAMMVGTENFAIAGAIAAGLGFANIWPLLFSITVEEKPERASELSGLMCMAISGGAIVPLIMGGLIDAGISQAMAFVVPTACFAYLLAISLRGGRVAAKN